MSSKALVEKNNKIRIKTILTKKQIYLKMYLNYLLPYFLQNSINYRVKNKESKRLCYFTGRSHGIVRKFKISRILFRAFTHYGDIVGLKKASW